VAPELTNEPAVGIAPYIWCVPYTRLRPSHCFVVDDGMDHTAVGYVVCAPDTLQFVKDWEKDYIPVLEEIDRKLKKPEMDPPADWNKELPKALLQILYTPQGLLYEDFPNLLLSYPAHLHIGILPDFQRHGLGTKLIDTLVLKLNEEKVKGIHLIMDGRNTGAEQFYYAVGFQRFPEVLDEGISGELGKDKNGSLWIVKKLFEEE